MTKTGFMSIFIIQLEAVQKFTCSFTSMKMINLMIKIKIKKIDAPSLNFEVSSNKYLCTHPRTSLQEDTNLHGESACMCLCSGSRINV